MPTHTLTTTPKVLLPAVLVLLTLPALAGCIGTPGAGPGELAGDDGPLRLTRAEIEERLTPPVFETITRSEHTIEGADGATLWLDVYRPTDDDVPRRVPVILVFTPYQSSLDSCEDPPNADDTCPYDAWLVDYYAPRGYAVAFADVRGNHNAGGCIDQTGPKQWEDGVRIIEWLGTRDWSSGKVGMYGISYPGETQISTGRLNPDHLVTIVPAASVSNQYEYIYYDGVPYELQGLGTMAFYLAGSAVPGTHPNAVTSYPERLQCQPENFRHGLDPSGDWNGYWEDRDYRPLAEEINASILQVHGLQDWNVKPNHVDPIWNTYNTTKRLLLGQWNHAWPDSHCDAGEAPPYGPSAPRGCRADWEFLLHRWYDHFLMDIDTGILDDLPPVLVQSDAGDWRGIDTFPPKEPSWLTFHLTADGELTREGAPEGGAILHDYPREALCDASSCNPAGGAVEAAGAAVTGHPTRLVFTSEPLKQDLHTTGRPLLELSAETDQESTHWVVHLQEVAADGTATWFNRGYLDARHRDGVDDPKPLTPGEPYEATVQMFPQDSVVEAGHRIRLVLTNDDQWVHQDPTNAMSTVSFGENATRLRVPLAPTGTPVPDDALREGLAPAG